MRHPLSSSYGSGYGPPARNPWPEWKDCLLFLRYMLFCAMGANHMDERVEVGTITSVGHDYIIWQNGAKKLCVTFAGDWMSKEDCAESFRAFIGKDAAIPIDGPFFIGVNFLPGYVDGTVRVIKLHHNVASVVAC